jgi:hypothetical protein
VHDGLSGLCILPAYRLPRCYTASARVNLFHLANVIRSVDAMCTVKERGPRAWPSGLDYSGQLSAGPKIDATTAGEVP